MSKKILVACGSGIATSTVAASKIKEGLKKMGKANDVVIHQGKVSEVPGKASEYDLVVATAKTYFKVDTPVISGLPLIIGIGADKVIDEIVEKLGL